MPAFLAPVNVSTTSNYLTAGANPAGSGVLRLPNGAANALTWRNNANNNDIQALYVTSSDDLWCNTALGRSVVMSAGGAAIAQWSSLGVQFNPGFNIVTYGAGFKIGGTNAEKVALWGATPIAQPANTVALDDAFVSIGLRASGGIANFSSAVAVGTNSATTGTINMPNNVFFMARNNANSGDVHVLRVNTLDGVILGGPAATSANVSGGTGSVLILPAGVTQATFTTTALTLTDAYNISVGATSGTRIGTATTQKIAFWNTTPIVQPANTVALDDVLVNTGLRASGGVANFTAPVSTAGLTGATAASRYVGATTSGKPASGTFTKGDFAVDQTGKIWVNTTAGSPGTWTDVSSASSYYSIAKWGVD